MFQKALIMLLVASTWSMSDDRVDIRYVLMRLEYLEELETTEAFVVLEEFKYELRQALKANEKSRKNQIH